MSASPPRTSLDALVEIAQTINTLRDPEAVLEKVLEIAMETLEAERGFILLKAPQHPEVRHPEPAQLYRAATGRAGPHLDQRRTRSAAPGRARARL
ncbi:hypothetical protein [Rhodothermus marinus]|uniref:hypothetical protein n=1 Tax=Rhodothermus marinus TaxID=29549 RepID=UPI000B0EF3B0|nr:hypothetical protein [Rhodothermus marinus]